MSKKPKFFNEVSPKIDFSEAERGLLDWWYQAGIVKQYLHRNDNSKKKFRFLDGPITANNPMGVHHAHGRTLKDFFQRYKNMQGFKQRFQNGFDCQGLWVEVEEEKNLGFNSKREIEEFGLARFSQACRDRVAKYAQVQTNQSKRLGMFMDWNNSYFTMSETNNLYIWHFLKVCHQKGWLYKGTDSMPWCIRCGTAISQHELSEEGYREVEHDSIYVKFPLQDQKAFLLIWTTTPWTLLANVAAAVKPDLTYVEIEAGGRRLILAKTRLEVIREQYQVKREFAGQDLVGQTYHAPFDGLPKPGKVAHRVIPWDQVSDAEGTGLVHIAPGAGHEDFELGKIHKLDLIAALDEFGVYEEGFGRYSGMSVREVPKPIIKELENRGLLYRQERIVHSYPFCWRCKEELVFRVTNEWFIKVDQVRPELKKAASTVNWIPEYAQKRMQDWLTNMGDWPISRRRYWGLVLPVYECSCGEVMVIGSREELKKLAVDPEMVDKLPELHRPWIDEVKIWCLECGSQVSRIKAVGDCWLDAGIVPFSTLKYFEDKKYWREWFPFDFITEYIAQVKLWFYSTLFMAVVLENQAPWQTVLASGFIVDERGETMHKSKGNAIWFDDAVEKIGADTMRWIYLSRDIFKNLRFGFRIGEEVRRRFQMILWNSYVFWVSFADLDGWQPKPNVKPKVAELGSLDRWILSRLNRTTQKVTEACERFDPVTGAKAIDGLVQDLSTWYLRRSRDRVGTAARNGADKENFYLTGYEVLVTLSKLLAPYCPFLAESIYRGLRHSSSPESVHLGDWPEVKSGLINEELEDQVVIIREAAGLGHAARHQHGLKVRQPLAEISIQLPGAGKIKEQSLIDLLIQELNVKQVKLSEGEALVKLNTKITPKLREEGQAREIFRKLQQKRKELGCRRDERLPLVVVPLKKISPAWLAWLKENILADELKTGAKMILKRHG